MTQAKLDDVNGKKKLAIINSHTRDHILYLSQSLIAASERIRVLEEERQWRPIKTAPHKATEVLLRIPATGWPGYFAVIGHWAEDLSGSEQPPFRGWFRNTGFGFAEISPEPTHWSPYNPPALSHAEPERSGE
jgi:hypothetical protein